MNAAPAAPLSLDSRASWTRLGLSLLVSLIGNVGMWAIIVILPAVQAEFAVYRADASLPYTLTMIGFALGNFLIGRAVDRWGVARCLAGSAVLMAAGYAVAAIYYFGLEFGYADYMCTASEYGATALYYLTFFINFAG